MNLFFLAIFLFFSSADAPGNQEIIDERVLSMVRSSEIITEMQQPFLLQITNVPDGLYRKMVSALLEDGKQLKETRENTDIIRVSLEAENSIYRKQRGVYERQLKVFVTITHIDAAHNIISNQRREIRFDDQPQISAHAALEGNHQIYQFQDVSMSGRSRLLKRIAEPALISVATVITVYLLYNVRSQ